MGWKDENVLNKPLNQYILIILAIDSSFMALSESLSQQFQTYFPQPLQRTMLIADREEMNEKIKAFKKASPWKVAMKKKT